MFLAGSTLLRRGEQKAPQQVPQLPFNIGSTEEVRDLLESWRGPRKPTNPKADAAKVLGLDLTAEKTLTLDDVAPVAMPLCPHKIRLTKDELVFESLYKRKFRLRISGKTFFIPKSFECIHCHPVCIHGLPLTKKELDSGKRFSAECPACIQKVKDPAKLETFLKQQNLSAASGMSLTEGEFTTSYGLRITKAGKNFAQGGGSKEIEETDANYIEIVDDGEGVVAIRTPSGPSRDGYGPDDAADVDGETVDETGDPISFLPSETVKAFENARADATKEVLDLNRPTYEIVRDEIKGSGWIVFANDVEVSKHRTKTEAEAAVNELSELDRLNFANSKTRQKIEHSVQDVLAAEEHPRGVEKLTGMKEQKPNPKVWTEKENQDLQKEIVGEIERYDTPVRAEFAPEQV